MRHKLRNIPVRMANGKAIGTAEVEYDSEAAGVWLEIVLNRELGGELIHGMEVGAINGLTLDASITSARPERMVDPSIVDGGTLRYVRYAPPEYGSDGKAYEGSTPPPTTVPPFDLAAAIKNVGYIPPGPKIRLPTPPQPTYPVDPTHPHYADFDLDPSNRSLGEEEINSRFGFHKATLEGPNATTPRHAYLRNEFKYFADMLDRVLPPGRYKSLVLTSLEEASMWSHKSIAETAGPAAVE